MNRTIKRDFDLVFEAPSLRAFTKSVDGQERLVLAGTASSTAKDLYGDILTASAQEMMANKLRARVAGGAALTAWLNHSYEIPEDTLGKFTSAGLTLRSEGGQDFIDLDIECEVLADNPRALAAYEQVKAGITHGWSIGCFFTEATFASDDPASPDYWSLLVNGVDLLEISLVGIPANQRSWSKAFEDLQHKAAALRAAEEIVREADPLRQRDAVLKGILAERDAEPVVEKRELDDDDDEASPDDIRDKITLAIACIKSAAAHGQATECATDARMHGMCAESSGHLDTACAHLSAALAGDTITVTPDGDVDPNGTYSIDADLAVAQRDAADRIAELTARAAALVDELAAAQAAIDTKAAEVKALDETIAAKGVEIKKLDAALADHAKRSVGRKTAGVTDDAASHDPNAPEVKPEMYGKSAAEYARLAGRMFSGVAESDARSTAV